MSEPEISFGSGKGQVVLKGRDAIRAAGWAVPLVLLAKAAAILILPTVVATYIILRGMLSQ
jgi:hypothetical protein